MNFVGAIPSSLYWANGNPVCHSDRWLTPIKRQATPKLVELIYPWACRVDDLVQISLPGLQIDGFSVPRPLHWYQSPFTGPGLPGTFDHDPWYACKWLDARKLSDYRFRMIMRHYGETAIRSWTKYQAVRRVSWWTWYWRDEESTIEPRKLVRLYTIGQADEIKTCIARYETIAELRLELERHPGKQEIITQDIVSIERGDIDDVLLSKYESVV